MGREGKGGEDLAYTAAALGLAKPIAGSVKILLHGSK